MKATISYAYGLRSKHTFKCKAIHMWASRYFAEHRNFLDIWIDPFHGKSSFKVTHHNDIAKSGIDSHEWIQKFKSSSVDGVFFDPPYSLEQIKRSYNNAGIEHWQAKRGNQSGSYPQLKDQIARVLKPGGIALSFGWSSVGFGSGRGFSKKDVLLVCHSGAARDTICVMEEKSK